MQNCARIWNVRVGGWSAVRLILYSRFVVAGHEMDVRALSFDNASFDIAIDKGNATLHISPSISA